MEVQETRVQTDRVLTIPNILSMARLVGVPLFLCLILRPVFGGPNSDNWALLVLMLSGISDYLDGKLARKWNQISSLGRLLDPAGDRLYILSTLVGLTWREILPLWVTAALLVMELIPLWRSTPGRLAAEVAQAPQMAAQLESAFPGGQLAQQSAQANGVVGAIAGPMLRSRSRSRFRSGRSSPSSTGRT